MDRQVQNTEQKKQFLFRSFQQIIEKILFLGENQSWRSFVNIANAVYLVKTVAKNNQCYDQQVEYITQFSIIFHFDFNSLL